MTKNLILIAVLANALTATSLRAADPETLPGSDVLMKACEEELARSMTLHMADLGKPYFMQFNVDDNLTYRIAAAHGALVSSDRNRRRVFSSDVRAGDYKLDNTNFAGGGGGRPGGGRRGGGGRAPAARGGAAPLPVDDSPLAIREAIWAVVDVDYKQAAETLARKRAYMKERNVTDRPDDFTKLPAVTEIGAPASLVFDRAAWEQNVQQLSSQFKRFPRIQDSGVQLVVRLSNAYILNSEGTRLRKPETSVVLSMTASGQAEDGMQLSDRLTYVGLTPADLPPMEKVAADIETMVANLTAAMDAPVLDDYSGPVLIDGRAAPQAFRSLLVNGVVGRSEPVGMQRRAMAGAEALERQFGQRILPKTFQVFDDPTMKTIGETSVAGHYLFDDEGVAARRVDIVVNGVLKDLCMSRTPNKKLTGSNGHGRRGGGGASPRPEIGCLVIEDNKGLSDAELKEALIEAAKDAGLAYGIRVTALEGTGGGRAEMLARMVRRGRGGGGGEFGGGGFARGGQLGDPILAYKVFVDDGHEEPVRGCEFGDVNMKALKKIIAAGKTPNVLNSEAGGMGTTIVAPAVLFEELDLTPIEQENDTRPLLNPPAARKPQEGGQAAAKGQERAMTDRQLFDSIKIGMSRVDVERQLGKPKNELDRRAFYGEPRKIESWQSPVSCSAIVIVYSAANVLESKEFYGDENAHTIDRTRK